MSDRSSTRIYGILGFPARHSLSPGMHEAAFRALKIKAHYKIFEIEPGRLKQFLSSLAANNIHGLNVTIPYKKDVIAYLDDLSPQARMIGAVNTIKVSRNKLLGFNTDGDGFMQHLTIDMGFDPRRKRVVVLGAGGASRAVCAALCQARPKEIAVYNRDHTKTIALLHSLNMNFSGVDLKAANSIADLPLSKADLLVNTTSVGMRGTDTSLIDPVYLHSGQLVYDLVYNVKETDLLRRAKEKGCITSNGMGMLLYQGMLSFRIWTGRKAPRKAMEGALKRR